MERSCASPEGKCYSLAIDGSLGGSIVDLHNSLLLLWTTVELRWKKLTGILLEQELRDRRL